MAAIRVWTLDELHALPDDANKYELVDGELLVTPAPAPGHETVIARLHRALDRYAQAQDLGFAYTARAVIQYDGSQTEPDLMVRQAMDPHAPWDQAPVPILVVEVLSPSTQAADRTTKRAFYRRLNIATYWIVDPTARALTSIEEGRPDVVARDRLEWHPIGTSEPLVVSVPELFT